MTAALGVFWMQWLWPVVQLAIGLGLVIFVHELGHFLVAKRVGIRVDQFALGFGPRLLGLRRGETDYCVNLLPLGGYVKMLGQEDFKAMENAPADPRAFNNKSVGARVAVSSAGVVMNCLFAAVLFIIVSLVGMRFPAPVVGDVAPGLPAAKAQITWIGAAPPIPSVPAPASQPTTTQPADLKTASAGAVLSTAPAPAWTGLEPGDRIVRIDGPGLLLPIIGKDIHRFENLILLPALSDPGDVYDLTFERTIDGWTYRGVARMGVRPLRSEIGSKRLSFGISPASTLNVALAWNSPLRGGDRILAVNGRDVAMPLELAAAVEKLPCETTNLTVLRDGQRVTIPVPLVPSGGTDAKMFFLRDGTLVQGTMVGEPSDGQIAYRDGGGQEHSLDSDDVVNAAPSELLSLLGMSPRLVVGAVEEDSPAAKAGLQPNDILIDYGDRGAPTMAGLYQVNYEAAGKGTHIVVLRDGQEAGPMWIVPRRKNGQVMVGVVPTVDRDHVVIAGIAPGSLADRAGLAPGQTIEAVNDEPVASWAQLFSHLEALSLRAAPVRLSVRAGQQVSQIDLGVIGRQDFDPAQYPRRAYLGGALSFERLMTPLRRQTNPLAAVAWGGRETVYFLATSYATLKSVVKGTLSATEFTGPLGIGQLGIAMGRRSVIDLVYFMAMISIALAVVNFLPIPVVDGGVVTMLLVEKLRGRPLPLRVQNVIQVAGIVLILLVFVAVTFQDVRRIKGW